MSPGCSTQCCWPSHSRWVLLAQATLSPSKVPTHHCRQPDRPAGTYQLFATGTFNSVGSKVGHLLPPLSPYRSKELERAEPLCEAADRCQRDLSCGCVTPKRSPLNRFCGPMQCRNTG